MIHINALILLAVLLIPALGLARDKADEIKTSAGVLKITPVTHGSLVIEAGNRTIYVDPWSRGNFEGLPPPDLILITDIHGDHLDKSAIEAVKKEGTKFIAPKAVADKVPEYFAEVLANGEQTEFGPFTIKAVPMYNEKRGPAAGKFFHDKGRGNGYILTYGGKRIYISGDTEGHAEMRALKNIDVAFVAMNLPYTMPPEEAAEAVKVFDPKIVYPYHYRDSDLKVFEKALEGTGIEVRLRRWY